MATKGTQSKAIVTKRILEIFSFFFSPLKIFKFIYKCKLDDYHCDEKCAVF